MNNIKKYQVLILSIICLGFLLPQAYSISGIVLDSKIKKPIYNANIYIDNSGLGTITDEEGYFILNLNNQSVNSIVLKIEVIGYSDVSIPLSLSKPKIDLGKIYLKNASLELESIHVHSHKTNQISDISLSGQKLNDNLKGNIANTLTNQPNIGVNSLGTVTAKPVLRGYSGDRFLLTKDGSILGDISQSSIDHVITLDISAVNEIEVIRGPKSLVYGSNTIGGVINTTISGGPKVRVEKLLKKFLFGGESFNESIYGNMMLYIPIKNSQVNILVSNRNAGNQSSPIGELENTYSEASNFKLGFTKYNRNGYLNCIIENYKMNYGIPPNLEGHINGVDIEFIKNTFQANYHQDIEYHNFNQLDIKYNLIDYGHDEFVNNTLGVALNKITNNLKFEIQSLNTILGSEIDYRQSSSGGYYLSPNTNELDLSLYGYNNTEFNSFNLLSSFRLSYLSIKPDEYNYSNIDNEQIDSRSYNYFSSSIGIKKNIDKFELNSWIMNTMRAPRFEELYSDGPHLAAYSYEIGEPKLKLEKIYGIESSIFYNSNPMGVSLTAFYNYSPYYHQTSKIGDCPGAIDWDGTGNHPCEGENFIEWGSGPIGWLYKYQTKGIKSVVKGLELNSSYSYQNFKIIYDFSLVRGNDLTNKSPLSFINPDKQILILEFQKKLINYKSRFTKIHSQNRLGEFESYTPSSFLVDFIISYSNNNQNITVQLNNIFNKEYYNHLSKIKSIMPEAGRNFTIHYKIFF